MENTIIKRRLKQKPSKTVMEDLLELQRNGVALKVVIKHHSSGESSWSEVNITTWTENEEKIIKTLEYWNI